MTAIDFCRSFLRFRIDTQSKPPGTVSHQPPYSLNNARIQLECRCDIIDLSSGQPLMYVLGASCKTERVGVQREIWTEPNADFIPIFSRDEFLNIKTYAQAGMDVELYPPGTGRQSDRQSGRHQDVFDDTRIDIVERPAKVLETADTIVQATLANELLVATHTELQSDRYRVVLEYPVKTINVNERDNVYQTDTGPILLPDFEADLSSMMSRFELAYSAFNSPHWIELIVRVPTPITNDISVYHYSQPLRLDSKNQILQLL